jgi:hypothetical protein
MVKYFGTHNSGTFSKLIWWQRPFGWLINLTSRCQTLSIEEQLKNNVRFFNLQVTYYKGQWVFSHGMAIYRERLLDAIELMNQYATTDCPVYYQLFLDKNFLLGQNVNEFDILVGDLLSKYNNVKMRYAYIEGSDMYLYKNTKDYVNCSEHYWTMSWAKSKAKSILDYIPLPKRHAKKFNKKYIDENKSDYLMLDFIEIK